MRWKRFLTLFAIVTICMVPVSQGEWQLQIHRDGEIDAFLVSEIDSMNVVFAPLVVDEMVKISAGSLMMGDGESECGDTQREVTLTHDFWFGQHMITNQEFLITLQWAYDNGYASVIGGDVIDNIDNSGLPVMLLTNDGAEIQFDGIDSFYLRESLTLDAQYAYPLGYDPSNHPVKRVTWTGAAVYCDWLNIQAGLDPVYAHSGDWLCNYGDSYGAVGYRLATDAEWEYATQWAGARIYPWGDEDPNCGRANYMAGFFCVGWTVPAGTYPAAPETLGLWNMAGNMRNFCNDWFQCNPGSAPVTDPVGPLSSTYRVTRGGCWGNVASDIRSASRGYVSITTASGGAHSFRIAGTANTD